MADYWTTPKTDWLTNDGIGFEDLNRFEANTSANRDANFRKVQGFGYKIDNSIVGQDGVITIFPGSCYSNNGFPIRMNADFVKNLTTFTTGNGATFGGMAAAVTVLAFNWYYVFVIMNPINGDTEIMFDDNPAGTNVVSGIFTEKRYINSFKTRAAGGDGSFDLTETYSTGDRVFINPNSSYADRGILFENDTGPISNDEYLLITLEDGGEGFALPARIVNADLNIKTLECAFGLISTYLGVFTVPTNMDGATNPVAEFFHFNGDSSADLAILFEADRKINLALFHVTGQGSVRIATRGFHDERLI